MRARNGESGPRKRARCKEEGAARACWIFLEPARCVRMEGHLMAAERSRWRRETQDSDVTNSAGLYPARK